MVPDECLGHTLVATGGKTKIQGCGGAMYYSGLPDMDYLHTCVYEVYEHEYRLVPKQLQRVSLHCDSEIMYMYMCSETCMYVHVYTCTSALRFFPTCLGGGSSRDMYTDMQCSNCHEE